MSKVPCGGFKLDENFLGMNENDELSLAGGAVKDEYIPKNYRVVFWISYDSLGNVTNTSCNCSYEELKSFCINKLVPILGSLFDKNEVKQLIYIIYNEDDASIHLQFYSGVPDSNLQLEYKQDGSIEIMPV